MPPARPDSRFPPPMLSPGELEPGVVVLERFCVLGKVRWRRGGWRVRVTDLRRQLGRAPHHRVDLHAPDVEPEHLAPFRRALSARPLGSRQVLGVLPHGAGLLVVAEPAGGGPVAGPPTVEGLLTLSRQLAGWLRALHGSGLSGVRFVTQDLRLDASGRLELESLAHLHRVRAVDPTWDDPSEDAAHLVEVLSPLHLGIAESLRGAETVDEVARRLRALDLREDLPDDAGTRGISVREVLSRLRHTLRTVLPSGIHLTVRAPVAARVEIPRDLLELMLVQLVLLARDVLEDEMGGIEIQLDQERSPGGASCVVVRVRVLGSLSEPPRAAVVGVHELCARASGSLETYTAPEGGLCLVARLPAPPTVAPRSRARREAIVMHRDARVRETLVSGLAQLGWSSVGLPADGPRPPPGETVLFTEPAGGGASAGAPMVEIVPPWSPGDRRVGGRPNLQLRIPFSIDELEHLLDGLTGC